jgi:hypothetical protein
MSINEGVRQTIKAAIENLQLSINEWQELEHIVQDESIIDFTFEQVKALNRHNDAVMQLASLGSIGGAMRITR